MRKNILFIKCQPFAFLGCLVVMSCNEDFFLREQLPKLTEVREASVWSDANFAEAAVLDFVAKDMAGTPSREETTMPLPIKGCFLHIQVGVWRWLH